MNKSVSTLMAALSIASTSVVAQSFTGDIGADVWFGDSKIDETRRDNASAPSLYFSIEHDMAYVPNASIRYTSVDTDYAGFDKYDFTFYYKILDRELMTFDAGATLTQYSNSHYRTKESVTPRYDFNELTFNWYAYAELYIPNTNVDIIGQFDFGNSKGIKSADVLAGLQYRIKTRSGEIALRGGYRVIDLEFDDLASQSPETGESFVFVNGFFVGAEYNF
ncbi:TIGR04219 family outer membrane beta-barrel protein [Vibrio renipiscarius]|uniref:TIGR04219 family outer membrane beta-barrel protein n=1 Tax=Vibrio renipiscarius TaxID=1461322 RepID=UPI003552CD8B